MSKKNTGFHKAHSTGNKESGKSRLPARHIPLASGLSYLVMFITPLASITIVSLFATPTLFTVILISAGIITSLLILAQLFNDGRLKQEGFLQGLKLIVSFLTQLISKGQKD